MIVSTGIDLIEVSRIEKIIVRYPKFINRIYTKTESDYCRSRGRQAAQSFAARFAAKEAFLKALGTGLRGNIAWQQIEIVADRLGAPKIRLYDYAAEAVAKLGVSAIHLTLSHTKDFAIAQVILESE
ncbi:MAG TPA: holo-ACP synthase [Pyrinomonadaceae bacterium]|nr:holo-ACP synthase [Pyrinomonadaceae bacterium]